MYERTKAQTLRISWENINARASKPPPSQNALSLQIQGFYLANDQVRKIKEQKQTKTGSLKAGQQEEARFQANRKKPHRRVDEELGSPTSHCQLYPSTSTDSQRSEWSQGNSTRQAKWDMRIPGTTGQRDWEQLGPSLPSFQSFPLGCHGGEL